MLRKPRHNYTTEYFLLIFDLPLSFLCLRGVYLPRHHYVIVTSWPSDRRYIETTIKDLPPPPTPAIRVEDSSSSSSYFSSTHKVTGNSMFDLYKWYKINVLTLVRVSSSSLRMGTNALWLRTKWYYSFLCAP